VNERGSSREDLRTLIDVHKGVVAREALTSTRAEAASRSASGVALEEQRIYNVAWEQYSKVRLPILLDGRARWARAGWFGRSLVILLGPLILLGWAIGLTVAQIISRQDLALIAGAVGVTHIGAALAIIIYYAKRVRLRKARDHV